MCPVEPAVIHWQFDAMMGGSNHVKHPLQRARSVATPTKIEFLTGRLQRLQGHAGLQSEVLNLDDGSPLAVLTRSRLALDSSQFSTIMYPTFEPVKARGVIDEQSPLALLAVSIAHLPISLTLARLTPRRFGVIAPVRNKD